MKKRGDLVLLIGIVFIILIIILTSYYIHPWSDYFFGGVKDSNAKGEYLKTMLQVCGGVIVVLGAYHSLKIVDSMNDNNKLVEKGNIAERFKDAIEMLDNSNSNICLGGIYALDNIAKDNEEYTEQVFNIFIAYINTKTNDLSSWTEIAIPEKFQVSPTIEIQTIVKILFSKDKTLYRNFSGDFKNAKLYGGDFNDLNFSNCSFTDVEFQNSSFKKTWFTKNKIVRTNFTYSTMTNTHFTSSRIHDSFFECCGFTATHFTASRVFGTSFMFSMFGLVDFQAALLGRCAFDGVRIDASPFDDFSFNAANMNGISIKGMRIFGGITARGAKFDVGTPASTFQSYVKSYIGTKLDFKAKNLIENFPKEDYQRLEYLLEDPLPESKRFNHTLRSFKSDINITPTGWIFADSGVFTEDDCSRIIKKYDKTLKKHGIKEESTNKKIWKRDIRRKYNKLKKKIFPE
ncbi:pentapeptide repeat-containing protein [Mangrovimonas sp. DI 80]|uniref:pentapeptide repeat-containing protein n=1 Tax=Mangrovimonas sp. DI 80 TaxID=1779330 RepID=UPI0009786864|nr:pentapeptide repeat-containing protein [Mangrovimonas sp. DI 80]OMP30645.1 hypothetical protein BKM32_10410 [Mangrovimonas sp. DI 80]